MDWNKLDIKLIFSVYFLQNPDVTQAQIAKELGISPIVFSRFLHSINPQIPPEWGAYMESIFNNIDFELFDKEWGNAYAVKQELDFKKLESIVGESFYKYLAAYKQCSSVSAADFRYINNNNGISWYFDIVYGLNDFSIQQKCRKCLSHFESLASAKKGDRFSIVFVEGQNYRLAMKYLESYADLKRYTSLVKIDKYRKVVEEEFILNRQALLSNFEDNSQTGLAKS